MHDDSKDKLIDYYSRAFATQDLKYTMMGMLLDEELVCKRVKEYRIDKFYVFGTEPLGIQTMRALEQSAEFYGFIDAEGEVYYNTNYGWGYRNINKKVYKPEDIKERYKGEKIILASFEELEEMMEICKGFAKKDDVIMINEFLFGGANSDLYK